MAFTGRTVSLATSSLAEKKEDEDKKKKKSGGKAKATPAKGGSGMIGGIIEAGAGFVDRNAAKKEARRNESRPKRRRLAGALDSKARNKQKKEQALATLSQSVSDWARNMR